jgi:hypothetical protein
MRIGIAYDYVTRNWFARGRHRMAASKLVESGRQLLRENPSLTEAEFRDRMLDWFRAADRGLQQDTANMAVTPAAEPGSAVIAVFMLPWTIFRWLGWRGRLARHRAEMDEACYSRTCDSAISPEAVAFRTADICEAFCRVQEGT